MAKFCYKCGTRMEDDQNFCGVCGAKAEVVTPQQAEAPQYDNYQPQNNSVPQYDNYQPQNNSVPQYNSYQPQNNAAPQYNNYQPQNNAAPQFGAGFSFASIDWMGLLTGKAPFIQNCLAALSVQLLSFLTFFLPFFSVIKYSYRKGTYRGGAGIFKALSSGAGIVVPILVLLVLLGSIAFFVLPLFQKKEIKTLNILVLFGGQAVFFLTTVITVIVKVISANSKILFSGYTGGWSIHFCFVLFCLVTLGALFLSGRMLFFRRNEVIALFKK